VKKGYEKAVEEKGEDGIEGRQRSEFIVRRSGMSLNI
jgi:hypothetical protein